MLLALIFGLILLIVYGIYRNMECKALFKMAFSGVTSTKNIAVVMLLIGMLTALWRATGTIAFIVSLTPESLSPSLFLPLTFLLCSAMSVLTGTSIGTAATIGIICMSIGNAIGIPSAVCGGAILSGSFFGDRCSPVSTSALLVAEITKTNIYDNIRGMLKTGWAATLMALMIYTILGLLCNSSSHSINASDIFSQYFNLKWYLALPAISILLLALFRIDVKVNMLVSALISMAIYFATNTIDSVTDILCLLKIIFLGFNAPVEIAPMLNGGGLFSMVKLILVVMISLTYAGLLKGLGVIQSIHIILLKISKKLSPFGCVTLTSIITCAIACNQTLSIVLTNELCSEIMPDSKKRAIALENSSVIIAPLIPWTVASLIPLGAINAPITSIFFACFLYTIPVFQWIAEKKNCNS